MSWFQWGKKKGDLPKDMNSQSAASPVESIFTREMDSQDDDVRLKTNEHRPDAEGRERSRDAGDTIGIPISTDYQYEGRILFYNVEKRWGGIRPEQKIDLQDKEYIFFHLNDVVGDRTTPPLIWEPVRFKLIKQDDGRLAAVSVERVAVCVRGTVTSWVTHKGFGIAQTDSGNPPEVHIRRRELTGDINRLYQNDRIEYFVLKSSFDQKDDQKPSALSVRRLDARRALQEFANVEKFERGDLLARLAKLAQEEDWNYKNDNSGKPYPILYNYVRYTFARLSDEGKLAFTTNRDGENIACFNTGLVTPQQEKIYGFFTGERSWPRWFLRGFLTRSDRRLGAFAELPDIANYFTHPAELLYDPDWDLRPDFPHIYERLNRFPRDFQESIYRDSALNDAIEMAKRRVRRNYKTAIPQFFANKLQLLLPLCLGSKERADLALVVSRGEQGVYYADTVLTLDMAYNNARLIARPDREWLEPTRGHEPAVDEDDGMPATENG
jgi:cold shock CspA family protein